MVTKEHSAEEEAVTAELLAADRVVRVLTVDGMALEVMAGTVAAVLVTVVEEAMRVVEILGKSISLVVVLVVGW